MTQATGRGSCRSLTTASLICGFRVPLSPSGAQNPIYTVTQHTHTVVGTHQLSIKLNRFYEGIISLNQIMFSDIL